MLCRHPVPAGSGRFAGTGKDTPFKGRKCCLQTDATFRAAYQDLHNLWPTFGEVNERRSNCGFGQMDGEARRYGRCDVEIDEQARVIEPPDDLRGDIARINLYME